MKMDDESLEQVEWQLAGTRFPAAPSGLRAAVLSGVQLELRASRWDRRLAWTTALLLIVGVGLNVGIVWQESIAGGSRARSRAPTASRQSLVDTAVLVAEATDAATGSQFARQLAALSGRELTADDAAAIDAAIGQSPAVHHNENRSRG
jgi:hypothetical protein